jgi:hypothetical protein
MTWTLRTGSNTAKAWQTVPSSASPRFTAAIPGTSFPRRWYCAGRPARSARRCKDQNRGGDAPGAEGACRACSAEVELRYERRYPPTLNALTGTEPRRGRPARMSANRTSSATRCRAWRRRISPPSSKESPGPIAATAARCTTVETAGLARNSGSQTGCCSCGARKRRSLPAPLIANRQHKPRAGSACTRRQARDIKGEALGYQNAAACSVAAGCVA